MQDIKIISDIRIGHVIRALLALLISGFTLFCMWMGEMMLCLLIARLLHLKYDAFPNEELNAFCGNLILIVVPLIGSMPFVALVWKQFYPHNGTGQIDHPLTSDS